MSIYYISGNNVTVERDDETEFEDELPLGTYTMNVSQSGYYLTKTDPLTLPDKVYGNVDRQVDRIINTFEKRPLGTGVHLDGVKGSGKTLLTKQLSQTAMERGYSTIIINSPFSGDGFNEFVQSISTPCLILFDEFEKTYDYESQESVLTLFDGVCPSKKLYIITTNDSHRVSDFLKNRPGRMFYKFSYETLDQETIKEVIDDRLVDQSQSASIIRYTKIFSFLNFDMLIAIIEEMNRYGESLNDVLKVLNVSGEVASYERFDISVKFGDVIIPMYENRSFDVNRAEMHFNNEEILDEAARIIPELDNIDFDCDSCPKSVVIGGAKLTLDSMEHVEFNASNLARFNEPLNQFEYESTINGTPVMLTVKKRLHTGSTAPSGLDLL